MLPAFRHLPISWQCLELSAHRSPLLAGKPAEAYWQLPAYCGANARSSSQAASLKSFA